jgi:hypothetical protein
LVHAVKVTFESIHVSGPESSERSQPGVDLLERFRFKPIETALCVHRRFYEASVAEYSKVL